VSECKEAQRKPEIRFDLRFLFLKQQAEEEQL